MARHSQLICSNRSPPDAAAASTEISADAVRPGLLSYRRPAVPGPLFLTFGLCEPRGSVCLGLAGCFLRAARFSFFRSALSFTDFVFNCCLLFQ